MDNKGTWLVRYFGRLCLKGVLIDIAGDEKMNLINHSYDKISWKGYDLYIENFRARYKLEQKRGRIERLKAFEEYIKKNNIVIE